MPPELLQIIQRLLGGGGMQQPQPQQGGGILDILRATDPDPVGTANKLSQLPSTAPGSQNPFMSGFFNPENQAASMSPEARLASQGASATNQWAALGGMPGVVDPKVMNPFMQAKQTAGMAAPPRTDYGEVVGPTPIPVAPPPQVGSWMGNVNSGWELLGPSAPGEGGGNVLGMIPPGSTPAAPPIREEVAPPYAVGKGRKPRNPFGQGNFGFGAGGRRPAFGY